MAAGAAGGLRLRLVLSGWTAEELQDCSVWLGAALRDDLAALADPSDRLSGAALRRAAPSISAVSTPLAGAAAGAEVELALDGLPNAAAAERALVGALYKPAPPGADPRPALLPLPAATQALRQRVRRDGPPAEADPALALVRCAQGQTAPPAARESPRRPAPGRASAVAAAAGYYVGWFEHPAVGDGERVHLALEISPDMRGVLIAAVGSAPSQTNPVSVLVDAQGRVSVREDGGVTELRALAATAGRQDGEVVQLGQRGGRFTLAKVDSAAFCTAVARHGSRMTSPDPEHAPAPAPAAPFPPEGLTVVPPEPEADLAALAELGGRQQREADELRAIVEVQAEMLRLGDSGAELLRGVSAHVRALRRRLDQLLAEQQELRSERQALADALLAESEQEHSAQQDADSAAQPAGLQVRLGGAAQHPREAPSARGCRVVHPVAPPPAPGQPSAPASSSAGRAAAHGSELAQVAELHRLQERCRQLEAQPRLA